jgi:1-acyl-sn-glycerol-3-phosphate acyltransferase
VTDELTDGTTVSYRPSDAEIRATLRALAPFRALAAPRFYGIENVPREGAVLLVGNHSIYGLIDPPLMVAEIYTQRGRFVRSLAEHAHYRLPGWRDLLQRGGAVRGTRDNTRALFAAGEAVLVFPGGGREVAKRKDEKYQLLWKERTGFARMAIEAGAPIVPFAAVGIEDEFDIVVDADHGLLRPLRRAVESVGGRWDLAWPLGRFAGPLGLPKGERFYYWFGEPVDTTKWAGRDDDTVALAECRDAVREAVYAGIEFLHEQRAADPHRYLIARLAAAASRLA